MRPVLLCTLLLLSHASEAQLGARPNQTLGARDITSQFHLPPFKDRPSDPVGSAAQSLQVVQRAKRLGLTAHSGTEAWMAAAGSYQYAENTISKITRKPAQVFNGLLASDLNKLMSKPGVCAVQVQSALLRLDTPIYPRDHCILDLGHASLQSIGHQPYQIQLKHRTDVAILGGSFASGDWGISITRSNNITLTGLQMDGLAGGGVMVTHSSGVVVSGNHFRRLGGSAVTLHGDTHHTVVANNEMLDDTGWSNWHAAVVITDRNADPGDDATTLLRRDGILVTQTKIVDRLTIPHDNVIARNHIAGNLTSGIYSDGGARNVYVENTVENNSKEGMCLDNGSTANVVAFNIFRGNGARWGSSDAALKRDFVWNLGRLPDGTSPAKLPGISMDNALYNQVVFNQVERNFGCGIKLVRSSIFNRIGMNLVLDDNEGNNPKFHFFGILVGSATPDENAWDLDFVPSRGNQIFGNTVRGDHYSGIFFTNGTDGNAVFDNSIFGASHWALESQRPQQEDTLNNLSNLPSRNIDTGLDPNLVGLAKGRIDR